MTYQLNDCWPVTSWAIVDYYLRPKPAYFTVAREMRQITVGVARKDKKSPPEHNPKSVVGYKIEHTASAWASNTTTSAVDVRIPNFLSCSPDLIYKFSIQTDFAMFHPL